MLRTFEAVGLQSGSSDPPRFKLETFSVRSVLGVVKNCYHSPVNTNIRPRFCVITRRTYHSSHLPLSQAVGWHLVGNLAWSSRSTHHMHRMFSAPPPFFTPCVVNQQIPIIISTMFHYIRHLRSRDFHPYALSDASAPYLTIFRLFRL